LTRRFDEAGTPAVAPAALNSKVRQTLPVVQGVEGTGTATQKKVLDSVLGKPGFLGVPAAAGGAAATMPSDAQASVADAVFKQYMGGRDLSQITPADVAGNTGAEPSLIGRYLDAMRAKVGGLPTRMEQTNAVKAIRDNGGIIESDTSPTGFREANGRFARAAE